MDKIKIKFFLAGIAGASLISAIAFGFLRPIAKEHVYLDVDKVITKVASSIAEKGLPTEETAQQITSHKKKFDEELHNYAKKNNVIIFSSPKPIAGAKDVTEHFIQRIG